MTKTPMLARLTLWGLIIFLLTVLLLKSFLIGRYRIPQNGMYPGLPTGSSLFTYKRAYSGLGSVKRGDIVVFIREQEGRQYNYISRVVALPGDKVQAAGESLILNDHPVQRQRLREAEGRTIFLEQNGEAKYEVALDKSPEAAPPEVSLTVPPDCFFVMGDNRFNAFDSRDFGPIPFNSIIGKKL